MITLKLALRNIFRNKGRSLITLSTIAFGCVALIFVGGFFEDLFLRYRENFIRSKTGHIQIYRRGFNEHGKIDPFNYLIEKSDEIKQLIKTLPEVRMITARLNFSGLISTGENTISFVGQGIEPENERHLRIAQTKNIREFSLTEDAGLPVTETGEGLVKEDTKHIVLGSGLAQTMEAQVGSTITLLTNTVYGATNAMDVNVKGAFYTGIKDFDDIFLRLPLATAQKLLGTHAVDSIVIRLYETTATTKFYNKLKEMIIAKKWDLEIKRWEELADFYNKMVTMLRTFYLIMQVIVMIVVVMGIFNTLNMAVMERTSEIGTMMALGQRRRQVMELFLVEGFFLGVIGGAIGVLSGALIVKLVPSVGICMPPPPGGSTAWLSTPAIVPSVLFSTFCLAVLVGGVSSLYPAYKASRMEITTALRYR